MKILYNTELAVQISEDSGYWTADDETEYDRFRPDNYCKHEFVNVGFTHIKMVCKHCDLEESN